MCIRDSTHTYTHTHTHLISFHLILIQTIYFRYGQQEEDRQWDSGGRKYYYDDDYYNNTGYSGQIRDQYENRINSSCTNRGTSNKDMMQYQSQSQDDEQEVS